MGGMGSGPQFRRGGKKIVERALALAVWDFRDVLKAIERNPNAKGEVTWTPGGASVGWSVVWIDPPTLALHYRRNGDAEPVSLPIRLQTTPTQFGGKRWWFTCPLAKNGMACDRRVGKLYLPLTARYFGCRTCYDLTYRSCQQAHKEERRARSIRGMERWIERTVDWLKSKGAWHG